jgi:phenylacetate-CoA ligase
LTPNEETVVKQEMERYLEPNISIDFERVKVLKRTKAGKLKQFVSKLNS